ncbi:MAG: hypothetical protein COC01_06190, partial [Bacteroidetes bacterium]
MKKPATCFFLTIHRAIRSFKVIVPLVFFLTTTVNAQIITTIAGTDTAGFSGDGGPADSAQLYYPYGVEVDAQGNVYIADRGNQRIRKIDTAGIITTIAGTGTLGYSGDGSAATSAQIYFPYGIEVDAQGNVYIADQYNHGIRRIDTAGIITTITGTGTLGYSGDGGAATSAQLNYPSGVEVDAQGNVYIADYSNHRIRRIDTAGIIITIAGTGTGGYSGDGGAATSTQLNYPSGVEVDAQGNVYVADLSNQRIRKIDTAGIITTIAGTGTQGYSGDGGAATLAQLSSPAGVEVDAQGNVYIADQGNQRMRKIDTAGIITTIAGTGTAGYSGDGGAATSAHLFQLTGVEVDAQGNVYIADQGNNRIRKIAVCTIPDIPTLTATYTNLCLGDNATISVAGTDSLNSASNLYWYTDSCGGTLIDSGTSVTVSPIARTKYYVRGEGGCVTPGTCAEITIIVVDPCPIITTIAGTGTAGYSGDGGPADSAALYNPARVFVDAAGNIYIADYNNHRIRLIDTSGVISTIAGTGTPGFSGDGGSATTAQLNQPSGVHVDAAGNIYIADNSNNRIRFIDTSGVISTIAGTGTPGFSGDGAAAVSAQLNDPGGVVVDAAGNIYIVDGLNNRIRLIDTSGVISTIAGTGTAGFSGDGGPATSAQINYPAGVDVDLAGNIYFADWDNHRIRLIDTSGVISTFAGVGTVGFSGDGGPATSAQLNYPGEVHIDAAGNIYIADDNNRIRLIDTSGVISTIAGTGVLGFSGDGAPATSAQLYYPEGVHVDAAGNIYIADWDNHRIRKITYYNPPYQPKVYIPDTNFRNFINTTYPGFMVGDSLITDSAALNTGVLDCSSQNIVNLSGVEHFINIQYLWCMANKLTGLPDLSNLTELIFLECYFNPDLGSLPDLSNNTKLEKIYCTLNGLTSIPDLSSNVNLRELVCSANQIKSLPDLSNNAALIDLMCESNKLTELPDLSSHTLLTRFWCNYNNLDFSDTRELRIGDTLSLNTDYVYSPQNPFGKKDTVNSIIGASVQLTIANQDSANSYQWFRSDSTKIAGATDTILVIPNAQFSDSGSYFCRSYGTALQVMGIDSFQSEMKYAIINAINPISIVASFSEVICYNGNDGSLDISVTGGTSPFTYSWSNGSTSNNITNLIAGTYFVTIMDDAGQKVDTSYIISQPDSFIAVFTTMDESCPSANNGTIAVSVTGGTGTYTYQWSNSSTAGSINNLTAGSYLFTVMDQNGCSNFYTTTITTQSSSCDSVWPGDCNTNGTVHWNDLFLVGRYYKATGPVRTDTGSAWKPFVSNDWGVLTMDSVDLKHIDGNGDGVIDINDGKLIERNYFQTHAKTGQSRPNIASNPDLYFDVLSNDIAPGTTVEIAIIVGRDTSATIYGIGFELDLDRNLIAPNSLDLD